MAVSDNPTSEKNFSTAPNARGRIILSAIINEHLITGEPIGSKIIAEKFANASGLSSATIRSVMSDLEDFGLVEQPHTSAGRIPTDRGYRFYVDNLLGVLQLSNDDLRMINAELGLNETDSSAAAPDRLMEKTSQLLSALSQNVGIVVSPSLAKDRLQHIEFVNLSDKRILVVLVSAPNIVHNKIIRLNEAISNEQLDRTSNYLNARFSGKSLAEIRTEILRLMHEETSLFDKMLQTAMILCSQSIEDEADNQGEVYVDGASNILAKRDFADLEQARALLRTIEEKSRLVQILTECIERDPSLKNDVQIVIGSENSASSFRNCTLITAPYRIGNGGTVGTLSVLGPTRIEYARTISIVSYVARILEKMMTKEYSGS